ncbi:MAG TPA: NrfD/PsrC family molybdoenzyme membrane anchor subunit [Nitrospinota bacterium]|nr:NrfD/PsrC family molybdoenzyme membrane anchor subunit [Nitrospinota bacterium]|tara:strand:+ start:36534 stop:37724 length:1191 start_codon:yes stop_codon:yes gene_type:complete
MAKTKYTKIDGSSKEYWGLFGITGFLALLAPLSALYIFVNGHHVTGMTNQVPWGLPIVMAVYLIGASAGSLVLSAMSSVFGKKEFKPFSRMAALLAILLIIAALMAIILDWGRPDRLMLPFFYFQPRSMFSLNAILYSAYVGLCGIYLWAMFNDKGKLEKLLGISAVFLAVLVHSGTGAIFGFVYVRELYNSPLLSPAFIAAALSSGTAMMIIMIHGTFKLTGRHVDAKLIYSLAKLMGIFIIVVLYFIFVENLTRAYAPKNYEAVSFLLFNGGKYTNLFWVGLLGLGLIIPMSIVLNPKTGKSTLFVLIAAWMQLIGVVIERYIIVIPPQVLPLELFPDKQITSTFLDGQIASYNISFVEICYSIGLIGVVLFGFIVCIKLWPMLPTEAHYQELD